MIIERTSVPNGETIVPSIILTPEAHKGAAIVVHGYGGCKEEQLGLAWRIANAGLLTCVIDLRGHGEHPLPLDDGVSSDLDSTIQYCRQFGRVAVIGHSLGGRLALGSSADFAIGISPALSKSYSDQTKNIISSVRSYRVQESYPGINFDILGKFVSWHPNNKRESMIIFGTRDVPEIIESCRELLAQGLSVLEIDQAFHNDIFLLEQTFTVIRNQLFAWFQ